MPLFFLFIIILHIGIETSTFCIVIVLDGWCHYNGVITAYWTPMIARLNVFKKMETEGVSNENLRSI